MSPNKSYRVIISGGGTGGHIYPALAIARELELQSPGIDILFVGANGRMEMTKVPEAGYRIIGLDIAGFQRSLSLKNLSFPFKLISSLIKSRRIIREFNPDIAVGVGGYASGPTLRVAGSMGVKTVIQEQNSYAGVTNKLLAKKAMKVFVAYPGMGQFFPKEKIVLCGNPVRKDILQLEGKREQAAKLFQLDPNKKTLLVIGGSLGSKTINESVAKDLRLIRENEIQVIWQTGKFFWKSSQAQLNSLNYPAARSFEFIKEMDLAYALADVVISRAGALSVSELCITGKPCVLVPSPNVAEDHQTKNAMALVKRKAAVLVKDEEAFERLVPEALRLIQHSEEAKKLSENISQLALPKAGQEIAGHILQLIQ